MFEMKYLFLCVLSLSLLFSWGQKFPDGHENELTMIIKPRGFECFYQKAKTGNTLEIEYQVIDAQFGDTEIQQDLDINFYLYDSMGKELISDFKQSDAAHRVDIKVDGGYKFCFDNTYSHFTSKTVYFEAYVDFNSDDNENWDAFEFSPELLYNDTVDSIKISIAKVRQALNTIKHHQDQLRAIESRDRNLQEHNFTRVNHFSMLFIAVMVMVGAVQVVMVRSLFEEHSKLHKIFKLLS